MPSLVVRTIDKFLQTRIDRSQSRRDELAVYDHTWRRPAPLAPTIAIRVSGIVAFRIIPYATIDQVFGARAGLFVARIRGVEKLGEIVPDGNALLRVIEKFLQPQIKFVEGLERKGRAYAAGDNRLRMRVFSAEHDVSFASHPCHMQSFEVQFASERIQIFHDRANRLVAVPLPPGRTIALGLVPNFWVRLLDNRARIIRPCQKKEMKRVI